jgi:hypothetical protein
VGSRVHSFLLEDPLLAQHHPATAARRSSRALRYAAWIGGAIAGLFAVYLVGINILVGTHLLRSALSADPEEMLVDYASAYSWIPGRVHVEGLKIRGSDWNIQWVLGIDKCDFNFSPLDLAHRRFHASRVRGDGLTFRVRLRVDSATAEHLAALPPVPGFAEFPHRKVGVQPPPPTDAEYRLWSIQLDDVDARDVSEIWTDTIRYSGKMRVRGRWIFRPMRWLDVGPAVVDAETLDISYGPRALARGLQGSIDATVHPFDLRGHPGLQILEQVSTDLKLRGLFRAGETLETLAPVSGLAFARGDGPLDAVIHVDHGVLANGTRVSFETAESRTTSTKVVVEGPVRALFKVAAETSSKPVGRLDVRGDGIRLSGQKEAKGSLRSAVASVASTELALDRAFGDATFAADFYDAETPSLGPWASASDIRSGPATASGHFEGGLTQKRAHGSLDFAVEDLTLGSADDRLLATASGHLDVVDVSLPDQSLSLGRSRVQLKHVAARLGSAEIGAKTLDVVTELTASWPKQQMSGGATLEGADLNGRWKEVGVSGDLLAHLSGGVGLSDGSLDLAGSDVALRNMQAHFGPTPLAGSLSIRVLARRGEGMTDLSGTEVAFDGASTSPPSKPPTGVWWARARLSKATLRRGPDSALRATIQVTAKDASVAAAVIATQTAIPQWVLDAVPMTHLDATGDVLARPSSLRVRSLLARGDTDSVRLEYDSSSRSTEWALLVEEGVLQVGFHLTHGSLDFAPLVGVPWFTARTAEMRAHESEGL